MMWDVAPWHSLHVIDLKEARIRTLVSFVFTGACIHFYIGIAIDTRIIIFFLLLYQLELHADVDLKMTTCIKRYDLQPQPCLSV